MIAMTNNVPPAFVDMWFHVYVGSTPPPEVTDWYLVCVADYANQRTEWDGWYEAVVDGMPVAVVGK